MIRDATPWTAREGINWGQVPSSISVRRAGPSVVEESTLGCTKGFIFREVVLEEVLGRCVRKRALLGEIESGLRPHPEAAISKAAEGSIERQRVLG